MLLDCPALFAQRKQYFGDLRSLIVDCVGIKQWESTFNTKENIVKTSEYDQEIPQSQTADNPVAPRGRAAQLSRDTTKTN